MPYHALMDPQCTLYEALREDYYRSKTRVGDAVWCSVTKNGIAIKDKYERWVIVSIDIPTNKTLLRRADGKLEISKLIPDIDCFIPIPGVTNNI